MKQSTLDWSAASFRIALPGEQKWKDGWVSSCGLFGLCLAPAEPRRWVITHVPSGYRLLGRMPTLGDAMEAASLLAPYVLEDRYDRLTCGYLAERIKLVDHQVEKHRALLSSTSSGLLETIPLHTGDAPERLAWRGL